MQPPQPIQAQQHRGCVGAASAQSAAKKTTKTVAELLDWLNKYTFPEEKKFADAQHARRIARLFLDEMLRHGTSTFAAPDRAASSPAESAIRSAARL